MVTTSCDLNIDMSASATTTTTTTNTNTNTNTTTATATTCTTKTTKMPTRIRPQTGSNKPVKLRNLLNQERTVDNLHMKYKNNNNSIGCTESKCLGSMINPKPVEHRVRTCQETWEQAKDFIDGYYSSIKRFDTQAHKNRLKEIEEQIQSSDTYYLKETELIYGAKLAWRNAPRCLGRIQWSKLQVFDARFTRNANEMFEAICNHIKYATNKGSLRSAVTIFPQRVKSTNNDWRIWNSQLIGYAGYKDKETGKVIKGDPINGELTEICQRLGWQGKGTEFDVLPIVLSANGGPPQLFPLPEELVLRVSLRHPNYKWFEELGLEWYALPAVANMMLDVGGLQFTACPFSGWYMVTEIGTRDLGDVNRYNKLELVAQRMGLNTCTNMSLWRDRAVTELNLAVLDSFQQAGVTIVDHHTASETFMTHLANEQRLRGGCPADWVWIVPPTAGSTTQVFHQEMLNYHLLPNYEYMEPPWKNFDWNLWEKQEKERKLNAEALRLKKAIDKAAASAAALQANGSPTKATLSLRAATNGAASSAGSANELTPRHLRFKEIARAVKFTSKLFGKALSRRIKATILYATETGKSERFANKLAQAFSCAFNVHLMSMNDYDMTCLEHEALLLIITSTFGNGDPPENGELFAKHLAAIKLTGDTTPDIESINSVHTNPFFQMLSEDHKDGNAERQQAGLELAISAASANQTAPSNGRNTSASEDSCYEASAGSGPGTGSSVSGSSSNGDATCDAASAVTTIKQTTGQRQISQAQLRQQQQTAHVRPLSNVRFAVFALGSTAYPHFCAFGRYLDQTFGELGAERILKCACGDELCGQEEAFNAWSSRALAVACDVFCLTDQLEPGICAGGAETIWSPNDVKFEPCDGLASANEQWAPSIKPKDAAAATNGASSPVAPIDSKQAVVQNLVSIVGKKIVPFTVTRRVDLHKYVKEENLQTIRVDLDPGVRPIKFQPGDHVGVYPTNKPEVVQHILNRIRRDYGTIDSNELEPMAKKNGHHLALDFDKKLAILIKRGNMDPLTQGDDWVPYDTLPMTSIREALTRYLDITNPPNQEFLLILSRSTTDPEEKKRLQQMGQNFTIYEEWKNKQVPTLQNLLDEFKTTKFDPALMTQIPPLKPRFYSISGLTLSLTLGVVRYHTSSGEYREGLCSNYLNDIKIEPRNYVYGYIRSAPAFHMPQDQKIPLILISAGTGIAPFRSFWQRRHADIYGESVKLNTASAAIKELTASGLSANIELPILKTNQLQKSNGNSNKENTMNGTTNDRIISSLFGPIDMYFGCRNANYVLYKDELDEMRRSCVLASVNIAFSRPIRPDQTNFKKMYVQDKLLENGTDVFKSIVSGAHIYVCGDVAMADGVYKTLAVIINQNLKLQTEGYKKFSVSEDGESVLMSLRNLNRYHEDIFGARR